MGRNFSTYQPFNMFKLLSLLVAAAAVASTQAVDGTVKTTMVINAPIADVKPYLITFDLSLLCALPPVNTLLVLGEVSGDTAGSTRLVDGTGDLTGVSLTEELVSLTNTSVSYKIKMLGT